jgi:hypothetical protein
MAANRMSFGFVQSADGSVEQPHRTVIGEHPED